MAVVRYEHDAPGAMLHMDTKKLGRIERPSHRVTGNRRDSVDGAGWEFAHVAIDDHSRVGFVQMHADERKGSAVDFLQAAVAHYAALGVIAATLAHAVLAIWLPGPHGCAPLLGRAAPTA